MHFTVGKISNTRGRIACRKTPSRKKLLATGACFHRYRSGTGMNAKRSMYASTIQPSFVSPMWATSCPNTPMHKSWPTGITIVFHKHMMDCFQPFWQQTTWGIMSCQSCYCGRATSVREQPQSCNLIPPPITSRCWQFNHLHVVKVIFDEFGDGHVKFFAEGIGFEQVA